MQVTYALHGCSALSLDGVIFPFETEERVVDLLGTILIPSFDKHLRLCQDGRGAPDLFVQDISIPRRNALDTISGLQRVPVRQPKAFGSVLVCSLRWLLGPSAGDLAHFICQRLLYSLFSSAPTSFVQLWDDKPRTCRYIHDAR